MLLFLLFLASCGKNGTAVLTSDTTVSVIQSETVTSEKETKPKPYTATTSASSEPSSSKVAEATQTEKATEEEPEDEQYPELDGSAMLGNSMADTLREYGIVKNMDIYARIGLNINTVYTKTSPTGSIPIIEELKGKTYIRVFLVFGENELGWEYPEIFIKKYKALIDDVREMQPDAKIYVNLITPVSKKTSDENVEKTNNARIMEYNELLKKMAEDKDVCYVDCFSAVADKDNCLPENVSPDGVHLSGKYCRKVVESMFNAVKDYEK